MWVDNQTCFCGRQRTYFNLQVLLPATELQGKAEDHQLESSAEGPSQGNSTSSAHHAGLLPPSRGEPESLLRWPSGKWDTHPNLSSPFTRGVYRGRVELSTRTPDMERQAAAARFLSAGGLTLSLGPVSPGP